MTVLSRRGVLRCLTGIIAAPAVVRADALMRVVAPKEIVKLNAIGFENGYYSYIEHFRALPIVASDWRYVVKVSSLKDEIRILCNPPLIQAPRPLP